MRHPFARPGTLLAVTLATLAAACADSPTPSTAPESRSPSVAQTPPGADTGRGTPETPVGAPRTVDGTVGVPVVGPGPDSARTGGIRGVSGVSITIYAQPNDSSTSAQRTVATITSGAGGSFTTPALPAGRYLLIATSPTGSGLGAAFGWVTIGPDGPTPARLALYLGGDATQPGTGTPPDTARPGPQKPDSTGGGAPRDTTEATSTQGGVRGFVAAAYRAGADSAQAVGTRIADATVTVLTLTLGDSTSSRPMAEREVLRLTTDARGEFTIAAGRLTPNRHYRFRVTPPAGSPYRARHLDTYVTPSRVPFQLALFLER